MRTFMRSPTPLGSAPATVAASRPSRSAYRLPEAGCGCENGGLGSTHSPHSRGSMKAFGRLAHQACLGFIAVVLLLVSAMPSKALPVDTYAPDSAFPWHGFNPNAFGVSLSPPHQSNLGQKIAKLSDGTLVASLVKKLDGSQDNGLWNLGLTRYDSITGYALA